MILRVDRVLKEGFYTKCRVGLLVGKYDSIVLHFGSKGGAMARAPVLRIRGDIVVGNTDTKIARGSEAEAYETLCELSWLGLEDLWVEKLLRSTRSCQQFEHRAMERVGTE